MSRNQHQGKDPYQEPIEAGLGNYYNLQNNPIGSLLNTTSGGSGPDRTVAHNKPGTVTSRNNKIPGIYNPWSTGKPPVLPSPTGIG